ncbi:MAG TPA: hypothetical protein VNN25_07060 [Thermoanaerobaculia bacterium]|nr:hypothetical protein [Thermoanaerobaculia bacterium]
MSPPGSVSDAVAYESMHVQPLTEIEITIMSDHNTPSPSTPSADLSPEDRAARMIALIEELESLIPGFRPHDAAEIRRVATAARFGRELIPAMISAVTSFPPFAERGVFDAERAKCMLQSDSALRPVAHRLAALLEGFEFTLESNVADTSTEALQGYAYAKHFARSPAGAGLRPYLAIMRSAVRKSINLRKDATPKPAPPTTPPGDQGFMAPNLASRSTAPATPDDDLPEDFRKALDSVSDDEEE